LLVDLEAHRVIELLRFSGVMLGSAQVAAGQ
jgi:hypothetical protein